MSTLRIPVMRVTQNSQDFFISKMNAEDLHSYGVVDRYRADLSADHPDQGYQRAAEPPRFKKFANYLIKEEHPFCPTAVLLSARDCDLNFRESDSSIELNSDQKLQIVDGQHRAEGYRYAIFERNVENLIGFEVPVIIMKDISKVSEMNQFRVINGTQKSVRVDLVNMILTQIAERIGEDKVDQKDLAKIVITRVVERLNDEIESPWHGLIVMPNDRAPSRKEIAENPELANTKIIRATSFMTSLKPIYKYMDDHEFLRGDTKEQARALAEIVMEFWRAVKNLAGEAFVTPGDYVIQKTPGLFALHTICKRVMPRLHMAGVGWLESEFENLLERSVDLSSPSFWLADGGEASKYGSMKGFTDLANSIDTELRQ